MPQAAGAPATRTLSRARAERRRARPPRQRSDLLLRAILVAIPAAIIAIAFIDIGGLAFAMFMIAVGCVCLSELYGLLHRWRPVDVVGFAALAAMVLGARYGNLRDVTEVAMAAVPMLFLAVLARGNAGGATVAIAGTLLGVYWVGFAFAHAELLRELPHGNVARARRRDRHVPRRHGRLHRRPLVRPHAAGAVDLPEQDGRGPVLRRLIAILAVFSRRRTPAPG